MSFGVIASAEEVCWYAQICYGFRRVVISANLSAFLQSSEYTFPFGDDIYSLHTPGSFLPAWLGIIRSGLPPTLSSFTYVLLKTRSGLLVNPCAHLSERVLLAGDTGLNTHAISQNSFALIDQFYFSIECCTNLLLAFAGLIISARLSAFLQSSDYIFPSGGGT